MKKQPLQIPICPSCGHPCPTIIVTETRNSGTYRFPQLDTGCRTYQGKWYCPNCLAQEPLVSEELLHGLDRIEKAVDKL